MPPATMAEGKPCAKRGIGAGVVTGSKGGGRRRREHCYRRLPARHEEVSYRRACTHTGPTRRRGICTEGLRP